MTKPLFDNYIRFPEERLTALGMPSEVVEFLTTTGLPEWCAPHMHFGWIGDPANVLPLHQRGLVQYVGLGEDEDDSPVVLALSACDVWVLPAQAAPVYVAPSVQGLSASLHEFQACIDAAVARDPKAFVEARIPPSHLKLFSSWAMVSNPSLVQPGTFWARELCRLDLTPQSLDPVPLPGRQCP